MAGSAFFTAASGLRNHQVRIDAIANNIANVNTSGYKTSRVIFADVLSQTIRGASAPTGNLGGINPQQVGLGMQLVSINSLMQQAALENTGRQTDFAINGAGFFVLTDGNSDVFTRSGNFSLDSNGTLVASTGQRVQGYNQLTRDGREIDPGSRVGDIVIKFGKKLEARATTELEFASNLDAASFRYGSANNETANVGTTGILTFAGAAEPWTVVVGSAIPGIPAGAESLTINGIVINYDASGAADTQEVAEIIAEAINIDPTLGVQVQATVREDSGNYHLVLQAVNAATSLDITAVGANSGLAVALYEPPTEPGSFLVADNVITVTDAKAARVTTTVPVGTGVNAPIGPVPGPADTFDINGVTVTLASTYLATNTAAQNAVLLANDINDTPNITVTATANANGTVTLEHNYAGKQRQPDVWGGPPPPAWADYDIVLDFSGSVAGTEQRLGFNSISEWENVDFGGVGSRMGGIDNGENAQAELVFTPDDGSPPLVRYYEDWTYDRSTVHDTLATIVWNTSTLSAVQGVIEGSGATFPLLPGVNISIDELSAGQATFRTEDAFVHTTSRIVYDSLGNPHNLTISFTHVDENTWDFEVTLPEEPNIELTNATGRVTFSRSGLITSGNPIDPVEFTAPGADPTQIDLIYDGRGEVIAGITQYASDTTAAAREQDGFAMGVLTDFEADSSGTILGFYDNGQRRPIAQLVLATFNNPEGLAREGETSYQYTTNSGQPVYVRPSTGGSGVIFNNFLEQSNVDLALEFTNLIITERGLQANSRVFTTQDEILNEIVNLKR